MHSSRRVVWPAVVLTLLSTSTALFAQRPLCNQLPAQERERARASGLCRDPAPIVDVAPRAPDAALPPTVPSTATSLAVPNVVGNSFDDARTRLKLFTVQRSYRAAAEAGGTVLAQTPMAPATLPAGGPVTLVLSDGSLVRVPRVTNININDARQRLQKDVDLKAQPVVITSELRVGTVIEQQPAEGTLVKRGSVVRLQVSAGQEGPELIDVPNVVGMPFDRAQTRLARFAVERADRPRTERSSAPEGQVLEQSPRAAVRAPAGSAVVLTVSSAPRATVEIFEMPNVVGRSYADASRSLAEFKVSRNEVAGAEARGQIIAQLPAAGSTLLPGAEVSLQVSAGAGAASTATATVNGGAAATSVSNAPPAEKNAGGRSVFRGVMAIAGAILLGLIFGALLMRQLLFRQRAVAAADDAISSMSPEPTTITTVDILLEEEAAHPSEPVSDAQAAPPPVEPPETDSEPRQKDLGIADENEKHPGS